MLEGGAIVVAELSGLTEESIGPITLDRNELTKSPSLSGVLLAEACKDWAKFLLRSLALRVRLLLQALARHLLPYFFLSRATRHSPSPNQHSRIIAR